MNTLGAVGEKLAGDYLIKKGYHILQKNFRTRYGEIDIIAEYKNTLIFIEVKTRRSDFKGKPFESVTSRKRQHAKYAINSFLANSPFKQYKLRYDVISIILNIEGKINKLQHFENIEIV